MTLYPALINISNFSTMLEYNSPYVTLHLGFTSLGLNLSGFPCQKSPKNSYIV